jgi:hypothetical protein
VEKEILVTQSGALKTQWCEDGCWKPWSLILLAYL